ncbi:hypothetical protein SAMN05216412_11325 [Nitrosospira multiformis]|uniref:Uncharacterized protein n=1 Tax=Nitrosospira multiformis TaxID=1231 RepID=A0A1I0GFW1_9PROT|nr:hypothetical protein [Nitrosospira multiformis]SET69761.1 hypothetical protein SAMN05216412_11325 [Nitrosospira multiformis]
MENIKKSTFELCVELIRALAWPVIAAALLISFWQPLRETANLLPSILHRSDAITIAGLSLKVSHELRHEAPPDVQAKLRRLSPSGIEALLNHGENTKMIYEGKSEEKRAEERWGELVANELAYKESYDDGARFFVALTPVGVKARSYLVSIISEFIKGLADASAQEAAAKDE